MLELSYKMVFAVGTIDSLYIYDTQSIVPRYAVTNIHFQALTDMAWNGSSLLAVSSADGYVSLLMFEKNELGIPEDPANLPEELKTSYENHLNIDINKTIYQGQNGN
jgi:chromatin assembly factor 1 subunit B